ncbi:MAG: phosphohistidine phosphatase [Halocynthiibacter sp.]|jgi:phosphohistidine phosphatase
MRLILARHAKSSWGDPLQEDFDRTLNERGRASAVAIGQWLQSKGYTPDRILCSAAARTQETCDLMLGAFEPKPQIERIERLYLASPQTLLQHIKRAQGECLMVIAHNPGIAELAQMLAQKPPAHADFARYPTCSTSVFEIKVPHWVELSAAQNEVIDFAVPRDLIG